MHKILTVVGTRPNLIKVTQFQRVFEAAGLSHVLLHTGQHYDKQLSAVFFEQFALAAPDFQLQAGTGSPVSQLSNMMLGCEKVFSSYQPDLILVVGDVNSTLAAALVANKLSLPCAHVESGLRSFDRAMPEEHNRVLTDAIVDHFFVTEQDGLDNLKAEGKPAQHLHFVGNTMIDTLVAFDQKIQAAGVMEKYGLQKDAFVLMTMHRPSNVDGKQELQKVLQLLQSICQEQQLVWPMHPRTQKRAADFGLLSAFEAIKGLVLTPPLDYFSIQQLIAHCQFILTDSGGIQEESTFRQKPCLTLRDNTERPCTVKMGTNTLVSFDLDALNGHIDSIRSGHYKKGTVPPLWDGKASERIAAVLQQLP